MDARPRPHTAGDRRVFISHATADRQIAEAICVALERAGTPCWIAPRDIEPGQDWPSEILKGLGMSGLMVLVASKSAQDSADVAREVERAAGRRIAIVPFRIDDVQLSQSFEYFLGKVQWLDARSGALDDHVRNLTEVVKRAIAEGAPPSAGPIAQVRGVLGRAGEAWRALGRVLARLPPKWAIIGALVLVAIVLHQVRIPAEVIVHVTTERVAFSLAGTDTNLTVLRGLPLRSLRLQGQPEFQHLPVRQVQAARTVPAEVEGTLVTSGDYLDLRSGDGLRLERLTMAPKSRIALYVDGEGRVLIEGEPARGSRIQLGIAAGVIVDTPGVVLVGNRGEKTTFSNSSESERIRAIPQSRSPIFELKSDGRFVLALGMLDPPTETDRTGSSGLGLELPFGGGGGLKIKSLDFTRKEGGKVVKAIREVWLDPLVTKEQALGSVYFEVPPETVFHLESVRLSRGLLDLHMAGLPATLLVGKTYPPGQDLVPSGLAYVRDHDPVRTICKLVSIC